MESEGAPGTGKFAWMFGHQRFHNVTVVIAKPGALQQSSLEDNQPVKPEVEDKEPQQQPNAEQEKVGDVVQGQQQEQVQEQLNAARPQDRRNVQQLLLEPEVIKIGASRVVLASASLHFRKRIRAYATDPWVMMGPDRKLVLVVGVEEDHTEAAQDLIKLIYEHAVPGSTSALKLAKMCKIADMWEAQGVAQLCLTALTQLDEHRLLFDELPAIVRALPDAAQHMPNYMAWVERCGACLAAAAQSGQDVQPLLLHFSTDVHALLSTPNLLPLFRQLAFAELKAWMASDHLVVDAEDSVAVAVQWWSKGDHGKACSKEDYKELSQLLRMRHVIIPVFSLDQSPPLTWFQADQQQLDRLNDAIHFEFFEGLDDILPPAWVGSARKQLPTETMNQRSLITLSVPRANLEPLLSNSYDDSRNSVVRYQAGTGLQLQLHLTPSNRTLKVGVYMRPCEYRQHGVALAPASQAFPCRFNIQRERPPPAKPESILSTTAVITAGGWGRPEELPVKTISDLEPYLVDGCLKLRATCAVLTAPKDDELLVMT